MISKKIIDKNSIVYFTACGLADESLESENPTSLKNAAWELGVDVYASTGLNVFGFASEHGFVKCIRDGKCIAVKKPPIWWVKSGKVGDLIDNLESSKEFLDDPFFWCKARGYEWGT